MIHENVRKWGENGPEYTYIIQRVATKATLSGPVAINVIYPIERIFAESELTMLIPEMFAQVVFPREGFARVLGLFALYCMHLDVVQAGKRSFQTQATRISPARICQGSAAFHAHVTLLVDRLFVPLPVRF
jgi:hypothetical protein